MAVARVQAKGATGSSAAPSVTLTAAPVQGNLLVAFVFSTVATAISDSSGTWTLGTSQATGTGGSARAGRMAWKIAGAGESATQSLVAGNGQWCMVVAEYSGVDTTTPLNIQNSVANASSATLATPSVTATAKTGGGVIVCVGGVRSATTYSAETIGGSTTGVLEEVDQTGSSASSAVIWDRLDTSITATAYTGSATAGTAGNQVSAIAVFNAAVGGASQSGAAALTSTSTLGVAPTRGVPATAAIVNTSTLGVGFGVREDPANQPPTIDTSANWGTGGSGVTSGPFTPRAGTLVLVTVAGNGNYGNATPTFATVTSTGTQPVKPDGSGSGWQLMKRSNGASTGSPTYNFDAEIWGGYFPTSPGSITVNAIANDANTNGAGVILGVRCLLNTQYPWTGATGGVVFAPLTNVELKASITPVSSGSRIYGVLIDYTDQNPLTQYLTPNTREWDRYSDNTNGSYQAQLVSTSEPTAGTPTIYGYQGRNNPGAIALVEVQAGVRPAIPVALASTSTLGASVGGGSQSASAALVSSSTLGVTPAHQVRPAVAFASTSKLTLGYTVPNTIDQTDTTDQTSALLTWINSLPDGAFIRFVAGTTIRIEGQLLLSGRNDLWIDGAGVTFHCHGAPSDAISMWKLADCSHIALKNMTLTASYASPGIYTAAVEHAHAIMNVGSSYCTTDTVTINNFGGDGIYYGSSEVTPSVRANHCSDSNVTVNGTGRNGISYVACSQIVSTGTSVDNIGLYGFDVEPNYGVATSIADHIDVESPVIHTCRSFSFAIIENGPTSYITLNGATCDDPNGFKINVTDALGNPISRPQNVVLTNNSCTTQYSNPYGWYFKAVDGLTMTGNAVALWCSAPAGTSYVAVVEDCTSLSVSSNTIPFADGPNLPAAGFVTYIWYGAVALVNTSTLGVTVASSQSATAALVSTSTLGVTPSHSVRGDVAFQTKKTTLGLDSVGTTAAAALVSTSSLGAAGASSISGSATLASTSTLGASGQLTDTSIAALLSSSSLGVVAAAQRVAAVALASTSTLAASGTGSVSVTAVLLSTSALGASGIRAVSTTAALISTSTLGAFGVDTTTVTAALLSTSALGVVGRQQATITAALVGTSSLGAVGSGAVSSVVALVSTSDLGVVPAQGFAATAALISTSTLGATGRSTISSVVALVSVSTLGAVGSQQVSVTAALVSSSTLGAVPTGTVSAVAALVSASTLGVAGRQQASAVVALLSTSTLGVAAAGQTLAVAALVGTSSLGVQPAQGFVASVALVSVSTLGATGRQQATAAAALVSTSTLGASGGGTTTGSAALISTSTLGVTGRLQVSTVVALASTSTLGAAGFASDTSTAALTSTSSLGVAPQVVVPVTAALVSVSTLGVAPVRQAVATAALVSSSTLSAGAIPVRPAAAALASTSTLDVESAQGFAAAVALVGTSTLGAAGQVSVAALAALASSSTLGAVPAVEHPVFSQLNSSSTLGLIGTVQHPATVALVGTSTLSVSPQGSQQGTAALISTSTLGVSGRSVVSVTVALIGQSSLGAAVLTQHAGVAALTGTSVLGVSASVQTQSAPALVSASTLAVTAAVQHLVAAALASSSTLGVTPQVSEVGSGVLAGTSVLGLAPLLQRVASAMLAGFSTFGVATSGQTSGAGLLTGSSMLGLAVVVARAAAAALAGTSTLGVTPHVDSGITAALTGTSSLDVAPSAVRRGTAALASFSTLNALAIQQARLQLAALVGTSTLGVQSQVGSGRNIVLTACLVDQRKYAAAMFECPPRYRIAIIPVDKYTAIVRDEERFQVTISPADHLTATIGARP